MKKLFFTTLISSCSIISIAQKQHFFKGMYIQWGYNKEWYSNSNIHFKLSNGDNFTIVNAKAKDKPDIEGIWQAPLDISIPQYNYRMGFYINNSHTKSLEINFDHIKYVVVDGQTARIRGTIAGKPIDADSVLNPDTFLHFEHTDGGNLLHINYVQQHTLLMNKAKTRPLINTIWKLGAGINIPRTDFTYKGNRLNNSFHIAGFNFAAEAGGRYYFAKHWFAEATAKTGYVNYLSALVNTTTDVGNRAYHHFLYFEVIGLIGYDINF